MSSPPPFQGNVQAWAEQLVNWLRGRNTLEYKNDNSRASQSGILLYNPQSGHAEVSQGGQFIKLLMAEGNSLPTSDPGVAGRVWVDGSGYLRVSLGP